VHRRREGKGGVFPLFPLICFYSKKRGEKEGSWFAVVRKRGEMPSTTRPGRRRRSQRKEKGKEMKATGFAPLKKKKKKKKTITRGQKRKKSERFPLCLYRGGGGKKKKRGEAVFDRDISLKRGGKKKPLAIFQKTNWRFVPL